MYYGEKLNIIGERGMGLGGVYESCKRERESCNVGKIGWRTNERSSKQDYTHYIYIQSILSFTRFSLHP